MHVNLRVMITTNGVLVSEASPEVTVGKVSKHLSEFFMSEFRDPSWKRVLQEPMSETEAGYKALVLQKAFEDLTERASSNLKEFLNEQKEPLKADVEWVGVSEDFVSEFTCILDGCDSMRVESSAIH